MTEDLIQQEMTKILNLYILNNTVRKYIKRDRTKRRNF